MIEKILIANRGEIAVRIIRACRELGIATVAVFSKADADALHTHMADEAVCIGPAPSAQSYLNIENILSAAVLTGAQALHPGFGFLSENARFARILQQCNIKFIGPAPEAIECMGNKARARKTMQEAGVPVIPGSDGLVGTLDEAMELSESIGFPLLVKASAGGGGRGIRRVNSKNELENAFLTAKAEALACFSDDGVYMEKMLIGARHVEVQILADSYGNTLHLGERDCSMQRRNQKMLEEAPCAVLPQEIRVAMGEAAIKAARAVNYENAGTVEFLLTDDGKFYFMEMNTRVQVEHPVTEMITGVDILACQITIAEGTPLPFTQDDIFLRGHAIECRINAENTEKGFLPSVGTVSMLHVPGGLGVRFDSAIYQGYTIPPFYDSMIGKLIVHAPTREIAIARMQRALSEMVVEGMETNIDFQMSLLANDDFQKGKYNIDFLKDKMGVGN